MVILEPSIYWLRINYGASINYGLLSVNTRKILTRFKEKCLFCAFHFGPKYNVNPNTKGPWGLLWGGIFNHFWTFAYINQPLPTKRDVWWDFKWKLEKSICNENILKKLQKIVFCKIGKVIIICINYASRILTVYLRKGCIFSNVNHIY